MAEAHGESTSEYMDFSSDSEDSIQTNESSSESSSPPPTEYLRRIQHYRPSSAFSRDSYDGSSETSEDSLFLARKTISLFEALNTDSSSDSLLSSEESENESESSETSEDEFPEISQLRSLFDLFETCPLTEEQKDILYNNLIDRLVEDRRKLREMEANYIRRAQFIQEFEAARKAADERNARRAELINLGASSSSAVPNIANVITDEPVPVPATANLEAIRTPGSEEQIPNIQEPVRESNNEDNVRAGGSSNNEERVFFPLEITPIRPSTKIVIPGPDNSNYDIEVCVKTEVRGLMKAGSNLNRINTDPVVLHCVIPLVQLTLEKVTPELIASHLNSVPNSIIP